MSEENLFERVPENSPYRCQGIINSGVMAGQCRNRQVEGSLYCPAHGGTRDQATAKKVQLNKYRVQLYQERLNELACDDEIKSLREEIAILRMTLETLLNSLTDKNKILLFIDKITALVSQIQKTVESAQRMEEKTSTLIDRRVVIIIADQMVQIVSEHVKDPDVLNLISEKFCASIAGAASPAGTVGAVA